MGHVGGPRVELRAREADGLAHRRQRPALERRVHLARVLAIVIGDPDRLLELGARGLRVGLRRVGRGATARAVEGPGAPEGERDGHDPAPDPIPGTFARERRAHAERRREGRRGEAPLAVRDLAPGLGELGRRVGARGLMDLRFAFFFRCDRAGLAQIARRGDRLRGRLPCGERELHPASGSAGPRRRAPPRAPRRPHL